MTKSITGSAVYTIGLDIAKNSFSAHGFDAEGKTVLKKELKRHRVLSFFEQLAPCRVGLEACASAHHWAREIAKFGHEVKLVAPMRVKAFLPRMKNDAADAMAIARAMRDLEMRFVPVKTVERQSVLMLFKARDLLVAQRTMIINALRGHFAEIGIVVAKAAQHVRVLIERVVREDACLPPAMREAMKPLVATYASLEDEISALNRMITTAHKNDERARRLAGVPGIGVLIATVLSASVSDPKSFASGREFAAWIGLVPRQHSTGGKSKLGPISKMGNRDLRRLLVVGATAALARMRNVKTKTALNQSALAQWTRALLATKPFRMVTVALANKMARIAWAIMAKGAVYAPDHRPA